jgi:predicted RNA methylase
VKIDTNVLRILSNSTTEGELLHLPGQLDRKDYVAVAKVIEAAGGKWVTKQKAHVFAGLDAGERLEQILLTGEVVVPKDDFGFFPTPPAVVAMLMQFAGIEPGMTVLEPSAGDGRLVRAAAVFGAEVTAIEINPNMIPILAAPSGTKAVICGDFLLPETTVTLGEFDRVLMNPPFGRQRDIDHVTHALKFLKHGGVLVAVMAAGLTFRSNRKTNVFRELLDAQGTWELHELPAGSFQESGTSVNTCVVVVTKA